MKAITIRQPWATLIADGFKPVENRKWLSHYRGPLAIHAAKGCTLKEYSDALRFCRNMGITWDKPLDLPGVIVRGAVIAVVDMVGCVEDHPSLFFTGPWGHVYQNVRKIEPVPCSGALGLWELPADVLAQVEARLLGLGRVA